jgi:hypothetical protein
LNDPLLSIAGIGVDEVVIVTVVWAGGDWVETTVGGDGVCIIGGGGGGGVVGRLPALFVGTKEVNV